MLRLLRAALIILILLIPGGVGHAQDATPVIPPRKTSPQVACDYALYCERNLIERFFLKIKHFRRVATRYDQTPRAFLSILCLVSAFIWTK